MNCYDFKTALTNLIDLLYLYPNIDTHSQEFLDHLGYRVMHEFRDNEKHSCHVKELLNKHYPNDPATALPGTGKAERACIAFLKEIIRQSSREFLDRAIQDRPHEAKSENWEGIWLELHQN